MEGIIVEKTRGRGGFTWSELKGEAVGKQRLRQTSQPAVDGELPLVWSGERGDLPNFTVTAQIPRIQIQTGHLPLNVSLYSSEKIQPMMFLPMSEV